MTFRFCDERGPRGFSWLAEERATRTSHALAADGKVWLIDALDWPEAVERACGLGEPAGVIQLLDRHNRDCAALASRLAVPHVLVPDELPDSPFAFVCVKRSKRCWAESALWWPAERTLLVAEALGTNRFFTGRKAPVGVHLLLRLTPPRMLAGFRPQGLLVGHGEGVFGPETERAIEDALRTSRRGLPGVLLRLPLAARSTRGPAPSRPR
jgi:hypothetical protein